MANVVILPQPNQVQTVQAGGQQAQSATEAGAPAPSFPPGTLVTGTITGKDTNGSFLLRTAQGTIALRSATPLPYNSDVAIRVDSSGTGATTARIVTVNGEPFASFSSQPNAAEDIVSPSLLAQTEATPTAGQTSASANTIALRATVISSPAATAPAQSLLTPGTSVLLRAIAPAASSDVQAPAAQASTPTPAGAASPTPANTPAAAAESPMAAPAEEAETAASPLTAAAANSASPTANASAAASISAASSSTTIPAALAASPAALSAPTVSFASPSAPAGDRGNTAVTVATASPPPAPAANAPSSAASANTLYAVYAKLGAVSASAPLAAATAGSAPLPAAASVLAQITQIGSNSLITLETPSGSVTLQLSPAQAVTALVQGQQVTLDIPSVALLAQSFSVGASQAPAPLTELAGSWQTLKDIVSITQASQPATAAALLARLPAIGPDFVSSASGFAASLLQNDARKLLGEDVVNALRQSGRGDLVDRFSVELSSLSQAFTPSPDRPSPSWQTFFLPFVFQEELQQARLYVKREPPKKGRAGSKTSADTRFIVEVDLSVLGPMQMDGLVRKQEKTIAFDLVVRSRTAFSREAQAAMTAIYQEAAELTGFRGTLAFQTGREFPVKPLEEALSERPPGFTV